MAHSLALPDGFAPSNLHLKPSVKTRFVESDVFDICHRLAEISPRLYLVELTDTEQPDRAAWVVMEACADGVQRRVNKYQELDQRMLEDVQKMLRIPFEHRVAAAAAEIDAHNAKIETDAIDRLYETMGERFRYQLHRNGFIDGRPTSYPKSPIRQRAGRV
jgi:hypothetical protein